VIVVHLELSVIRRLINAILALILANNVLVHLTNVCHLVLKAKYGTNSLALMNVHQIPIFSAKMVLFKKIFILFF